MRRTWMLALVVLTVVALLPIAAPASFAQGDSLRTPPPQARLPHAIVTHDPLVEPIVGVYVSDADPKGAVTVNSMGRGSAWVVGGRLWTAQGWYSAHSFVGIWRSPGMVDDTTLAPSFGWLRFHREADGSLAAHFSDERGGALRDERWRFVNRFGEGGGPLPDRIPSATATRDSLPKLGEYVYVEELPVATRTVVPTYPKEARKYDVEGTVLVQALVGSDGHVHDARIIKSIPMLDDAALAAVRQWEFKPAMSKGKPVAVWVAVPVKFSLH